MALIPCPDCSKDVSSKAEKCLNCGCPIATESSDVNKIIPIDENSAAYLESYESQSKSPANAIIYAFIFGPLGTFYVDTGLAFLMIFLYLISLVGSIAGVAVVSLVNMFVCYFYANEFNEKLKTRLLTSLKEISIITDMDTRSDVSGS